MKKSLFIFALIAVVILILSKCAEQSHPVFTKDFDLIKAHGALIDNNGNEIKPDKNYIASLQNHYIAQFEEARYQTKKKEQESVKKLILNQIDDQILANALYLDWLTEHKKLSNNNHYQSINNALRWYYLVNIKPNPLLPTENEKWWRGIDEKIAINLEKQGIQVFMATENSGAQYIAECRENRVPVPEFMYSDDWEFKGEVQNEFTLEDRKAELWEYVSTDPPGVCLALPRFIGDSDVASLTGIICFGTQSNKACFFDAEDIKRNVETPLINFKSGLALETGDECSDCHAGENPFVVHPDSPAFQALSSNLKGTGWYEPIVAASWPQNPGPTNLLFSVNATQKCTSCHTRQGAGRFPEVSNQLPGYCNMILTSSVEGCGSTCVKTMPQGGGDVTPYLPEYNALKNACGTNGNNQGGIVPNTNNDDDSVISPPQVIDPIFECATSAAVRGAILDAKVSLFVNDNLVAEIEPARDPDQLIFDNLPEFNTLDEVYCIQKINGVSSNKSPTVIVADVEATFPSGLPAPTIDPDLVYECASVVAVRVVPGAKLTVFVNDANPSTINSAAEWTNIFTGKRPLETNDVVTAKISLCGIESPLSEKVVVQPAPNTLNNATINPPNIYQGQELLTIENLTNGSTTTVTESVSNTAEQFTTAVSWKTNYDIATQVSRPLQIGDNIGIQQLLCDQTTNGSFFKPEDCKEIPHPIIRHPQAGEEFVIVNQSIPGARIRVYDDGGNEIGDGSGVIIYLTRALTNADIISVTQQIGECVSNNAYIVNVRNPD